VDGHTRGLVFAPSRRRASRRRAVCLALAVGWLLGMPGVGTAQQEIQLPADLQLQLLSRVLAFDRNSARFGSEVVIGVLYQAENRESVARFRDLRRSLPLLAREANGVAFRIEGLLLQGSTLPAAAHRVDVLYLAPLRGVDASALMREAAASGVLTATGVRDYAASGAAIGLVERDHRPTSSIGLTAARAAGSDFSSQLLRVADTQP
jgi:hypothetical protein